MSKIDGIFKKVKKTIEIIAGAPLFSGLPEDQLKDLSRIAVDKSYQKGDLIISEGDEAAGFYIIAAGQIKVFKVSAEGKEQILHIFGPGEPIGEVPVFTGQPFPAYAEALAKSLLLFFPRAAFVNLIAGNPSLALNMLGVLSKRLRQFTVQIENLSLKEVPGRLASYLIYLSGEQKNQQSVKLHISKGQLASLLGTIPETLSRIFAKMSEQGLIAVNGRQIQLLDATALNSLAAHGKDAN